jgi:hypothetical protein
MDRGHLTGGFSCSGLGIADWRAEPQEIAIWIGVAALMLSPLGVCRAVDGDARGFPLRREGVGVVHEEVGSAPGRLWIKVADGGQMDLDPVPVGIAVATTGVFSRIEAGRR